MKTLWPRNKPASRLAKGVQSAWKAALEDIFTREELSRMTTAGTLYVEHARWVRREPGGRGEAWRMCLCVASTHTGRFFPNCVLSTPFHDADLTGCVTLLHVELNEQWKTAKLCVGEAAPLSTVSDCSESCRHFPVTALHEFGEALREAFVTLRIRHAINTKGAALPQGAALSTSHTQTSTGQHEYALDVIYPYDIDPKKLVDVVGRINSEPWQGFDKGSLVIVDVDVHRRENHRDTLASFRMAVGDYNSSVYPSIPFDALCIQDSRAIPVRR